MTTTEHRPERDPACGDPDLSGGTALRHWARSGAVAFVVLTSLYFALSLFGSPHAYLSTDVGGKTAALAAMLERGDWSTDVGYWAAEFDPDGLAHPFAHTTLTDTGWWVNTTSLPMVLAARPLWFVGGPQLILLLPMMAAAGAAVVAGRLQQRLRPSSGTSATWVVGLCTPLAVYALDFWEHSIGVLFMALGVLLVLNAAAPQPTEASLLRRVMVAAGAGVTFGFAATMRQEALVYGFVAGITLTASCIRAGQVVGDRRRFLRSLAPSAAMAGGAMAVLAANALVERWFYGSELRSSRSIGAAASVGADPREQIDAGFTITFSPINAIHPIATFLGLVVFAGLAWLMIEVRRGGDVRRPSIFLIGIAAVLALRIIQNGPSYVPGLLPATPLTIAGLWLGFGGRRQRLVLAMALGPLPLVYVTQYAAGAAPQWGGRYILTTGLLLVVLACAELPSHRESVFRALVFASALVTASGVWFNAVRTTSLEQDFALIEDVADGAVVVWYDPVMAREAGPEIVEHRWLSTVGDAEREVVLDILTEASIDRFVYVDRADADPIRFDGFDASSEVGEWELSRMLRQRLTIYTRS